MLRVTIGAVPWPRAVIHADLDAFYASVEQLRRPELAGRAVIVGGAGGDGTRGVVSAASYEARAYGVTSAMPLVRARRLCPHATVLPVDFAAYRSASSAVFAIFRDCTPVVEPVSLDEAYLDVTGSTRRFGPPDLIALRLRDRVAAECGLTLSCGVAMSKVVAKVASDLEKPRGMVVVPPGQEARFLAPLPVRRLPGVGPAAQQALAALGISTAGQLVQVPLEVLRRRLGERAARSLQERAQGVDRSPVVSPDRPKSISREETFAHDVSSWDALERHLRACAADVGRRLRGGGWTARTVTLKLRDVDFTTIDRQRRLGAEQRSDAAITETALSLLRSVWDGRAVRLLGVGVAGIGSAAQLDLFAPTRPRDEHLDHTLDALRARFGAAAPRRGEPAALHDLDFRGEDLRPRTSGDVQEGLDELDDEHRPAPLDEHLDEEPAP